MTTPSLDPATSSITAAPAAGIAGGGAAPCAACAAACARRRAEGGLEGVRVLAMVAAARMGCWLRLVGCDGDAMGSGRWD